MKKTLTIGTRGSKLALAQTHWVSEQLCAAHPALTVNIEIIKTTGDRITDRPLSQIGGKGLFTKELEVALMDNAIDCAVHSLKDLPTELPDGLTLGAIPVRVDPRDVLVTNDGVSLSDLAAGAVVGTSSLRRAAQLRNHRSDIEIVDLRGNIDTRVGRVRDGDIDAAILASAGIQRLALDVRTAPIEESDIVPAPGQGALGIEVREGDTETEGILASIKNDTATAEVTAERTCLAILEGGCQVPLGIRATLDGETLNARARVCSLDGATVVDAEMVGDVTGAATLGERIANDLLDRGAAAIIDSAR
jgi:hydroxymethylbilane synthase